jgi:hypothetical protein
VAIDAFGKKQIEISPIQAKHLHGRGIAWQIDDDANWK